MTTIDSTHPLFGLIPNILIKNGVFNLADFGDETKGIDPSTVRGAITCVLLTNGLFRSAATTVVDRMFEHNAALNGIQDRKIEGADPLILKILWFAARRETLEWMDAEAPEHFARPMFDHSETPADDAQPE